MSAPSSRAAERVLLISMPFGALERPALSLGLLTAHCSRLGVESDTLYLGFSYAERVGIGDYLWICSDDVPYTAFAGDWLFAEALYGVRPFADAAYTDEVLRREWQLDDAALARLRRMRGQVEPFLSDCLEQVPWASYTLVGFTSVFQQNIASLALAARVKHRHPDLTIACGGANWEEAMGVALQAQFPFVDLAFSGEADLAFPAVLEARRAGRGVTGIRGVTSSASQGMAERAVPERAQQLDDLPVPEFDTFFEQLQASVAGGMLTPTLLVETARGCWWGERSHCTFCGLNGSTMAFRSKTPERAVDEILRLVDRHGTTSVSVVDDILDMRYFRSVLPRLAEADRGLEIFWEVKANLTHDHVRQLRDAGVVLIQPGIESLSDHVLKLMRKGTTALRNIELLKWCREYGVKPFWNMLYGFPGETADDYARIVSLIPAIWHLEAPTGYGPIRLDRFSPYHADPASFGMVNVRPMAPFTYLYPFERSALMDIAYYFDFDYTDGRTADVHAGEMIALTRQWMADGDPGVLELRADGAGNVELLDTRPIAGEGHRATLDGWKAAVYLACDRAQPLRALRTLPQVEGHGVGDDELLAFLERCEDHHLVARSTHSWLNLAVHVPAREAPSVHEPERTDAARDPAPLQRATSESRRRAAVAG
ncbi:MAG TPA: RiPP maturation radical SAM C-methyltransferase [Solirubrobacteraceae bacterium]